LAICPAGIDCSADAKGSVDVLLIAVDPRHFAPAAAQDSALEARLIEVRLLRNRGEAGR